VSAPLNFHLEHYDGPLDLLLDLIRKQELNIYDIPIAQITAQYLDYMQRALEMDVELSAEELAARRKSWTPKPPHFRTGVLARYARNVGSARFGAVTTEGAKEEVRCYADI